MTPRLMVGTVIKKIKLLSSFPFVKLLVVTFLVLMKMQNQVHEMILLEKLIVTDAVEQFPTISFMWCRSPIDA
jgi:hypothetical protein